MRPTTRRAVLALVCGMVLLGAVAWMPGMPLARVAGVVVSRVAGRVASRVAARVSEAVATSARADEMKFEPLSAESAAAFDRRGSRRHGLRSTPAPAPARSPDPDSVSGPSAPAVVIGKTGDVMRVGSDITVGKDEVVTGDVLAVGGDIRVEGHVEGNAVSMGGDIYLQPTAKVDGDVVCMGGELHEETGAVVGGKRVVGLGNRGEHVRSRLRNLDLDMGREHHGENRIARSFAWLLCWLLVGWAIAKIAPGRTTAALESFRQKPGTSFLVGWAAIVLTVPALIAVCLLTALLCITIIGIPLGIAVLFAYFLFLAIFVVWGGVVGAAVVGERAALRQGVRAPTSVRAGVTGVLILNGAMLLARIIQVVPFFGWFGSFVHVLLIIAGALIGVTGWGALLYSEFTTGIIARWWHGRRAPVPVAVPVPAAGPSPVVDPGAATGGTAVTTVNVPQGPVAPQSFAPPPPPSPPPPPPAPAPPAAPPSPPASFMPPPEGTPPEPTPGS